MRSLTRLRKPTRLPEMMGSIGSIILNENMSVSVGVELPARACNTTGFRPWQSQPCNFPLQILH